MESQIVKNEFKQEKGYRNSRLDIKLDAEGYIFKGNIINKEEVTFKFLNHIRGRLFFVGQVIREERKRNSKSSSKVPSPPGRTINPCAYFMNMVLRTKK